MADDLHDDWWVKDDVSDDKIISDNEESSKISDNEVDDKSEEEVTKKTSKSENSTKKSSKSESSTKKSSKSESGTKKRKQPESPDKSEETVTKKKKKRKKMTITEVLANAEHCPPEASQLIDIIVAEFKDKLPGVEYDDISIDADNFCECNTKDLGLIDYLKSVESAWPDVPSAPEKSKFVKKVEKKNEKKKGKNKKGEKPSKENGKDKTEEDKEDKEDNKEKDEDATKIEPIDNGSPSLLMITCGAIRATDLIRDLKKDEKSGVKIAKLFAKHLKLKEITKFLQKTPIHIGVGNPNRIASLLQNGSLSLSRCSHIVIDWAWRDAKQYRFIDQKVNKNELLSLLHTQILQNVKNNNIKFALF